VDRLACVDVPSLGLQLLILRHRSWSGHPAALLDRDAPQGEILQVNRRARRAGILPGLRLAAALSACPDLRAGSIPDEEVARGVDRIARLLERFTPEVEPSDREAGVFWLGAGGLDRLHRSPGAWARDILGRLRSRGLSAAAAVGFTRFGTYALARAGRGVAVLRSADDEALACRGVPLDLLVRSASTRDALAGIGVATVGQLLALPAAGLLERFGREAHRLHRAASGAAWDPLRPRPPEESIAGRIDLDWPDGDAARLTFLTKRLLSSVIARAAARGEAVAELWIELVLERAERRVERIRPAAPTLDEAQILDLARLRLESISLEGGVIELGLRAVTVEAAAEQIGLFDRSPRRDPAAAGRALARLRAEFGAEAVVRARLAEGHLPEARFCWEPLDGAPRPAHRSGGTGAAADHHPSLVRRIRERPIPLQGRPFHGPGGLHLEGLGAESVIRMDGPYLVSGGWWRREVEREYHFAETASGRILWVYRDRRRRRWFLQGAVE